MVQKKIRIVHFARLAPNQCGQYHTVKDLIYGERKIGLDAHFVDTYLDEDGKLHYGEIKSDDWLTTSSPDCIKDADVLALHTLIPKNIKNTGKPIISFLHGRPENTYLLESYGKLGTWSSYYTRRNDKQCKAFVTFWPELIPTYEHMLPSHLLYCISPPVDLKSYTPTGDKFKLKSTGTPNILVADMWREDVTPFNVVMAGSLFQKKYCPEAKIHIFGLQGVKKNHNKVLLLNLLESGSLGSVAGVMRRISDVYRSCDIVITPHIIATRVIRESLASGLSVVASSGCKYTRFTANPRDTEGFAYEINRCWNMRKNHNEIQLNRTLAETYFNPLSSAKEFLSILEKVL